MIPIRDTIPSRSFPVITLSLIIINILFFLYEISLGPEILTFIKTYGVIPARYFYITHHFPNNYAGRFLPIFTSIFLHGGWFHLLGNMLYLWIFGDNVEDRMGHGRFMVFYLFSGIGASFFHIYTNPHSTLPSIGASGAIAGVLGAYFFLFPFSRIITLMPLFFFWTFVEVPAFFFLGFWFIMQFLSGSFALLLGEKAQGGVAWWAHIGGFITGIVLLPLFLLGRRKRRYYTVSRNYLP